ncbi:MAG: hypothetical protein VW313_07850 [Gammaproteobacteria bacterium]|jgi:hypothetical protein
MKIARVLSGFGLTALAAPVFAHGDHGSMMMTQLLGHGFSGEHLLVALAVAAVSALALVRVAKKS